MVIYVVSLGSYGHLPGHLGNWINESGSTQVLGTVGTSDGSVHFKHAVHITYHTGKVHAIPHGYGVFRKADENGIYYWRVTTIDFPL